MSLPSQTYRLFLLETVDLADVGLTIKSIRLELISSLESKLFVLGLLDWTAFDCWIVSLLLPALYSFTVKDVKFVLVV